MVAEVSCALGRVEQPHSYYNQLNKSCDCIALTQGVELQSESKVQYRIDRSKGSFPNKICQVEHRLSRAAVLLNGLLFPDFGPDLHFIEEIGPEMIRIYTKKY